MLGARSNTHIPNVGERGYFRMEYFPGISQTLTQYCAYCVVEWRDADHQAVAIKVKRNFYHSNDYDAIVSSGATFPKRVYHNDGCVIVYVRIAVDVAGTAMVSLPQFAESQLPRFAAPPVASTPRSRARPFQKKVHIDKKMACPAGG